MAECGKDGCGRGRPRGKIDDRRPRRQRYAAVGPVHREPEAAEPLGKHVVSADIGIGSLRSKRGEDQLNQPRIGRLGPLPVEAEPFEVGQLETHESNIGPADERVDHRLGVRRAEIDHDRPLSGVDRGIGPSLAGCKGCELAHRVAFGRFNLDDVSPHPSQEPSTLGDRCILGELDDLDSREWPRRSAASIDRHALFSWLLAGHRRAQGQ